MLEISALYAIIFMKEASPMFKRKVYDALIEWKEKYSKKYAAMLEGARRVGKSTVAEEFAKNNFKSYIKPELP